MISARRLRLPLLTLLRELCLPSWRKAIVPSLPAGLGAAPLSLDVSLPLEPVEHRIEHSIGPLQLAGGKLAHAFQDGVAIGVTLRQNRKNERGSGSGDEVFIDVHIL